MHASKVKRRSSSAVEITPTSAGCVAGSTVTTGIENTVTASLHDRNICTCWTKLQNDSSAATNANSQCWSNDRRQISHNEKYCNWCRGEQQDTSKLLNKYVSKANNAYDNYSQLGKYSLVKKNEKSLLTVRSHENYSSTIGEEESCCCSRERTVYQSYSDLKRTSTQHYNAASSSSSSIRFRNFTSRHCRYQQRNRCISYSNLKFFIYWHAFSLLAYFTASGLCVRATVSESFLNLNDMKHAEDNDASDILLLRQSSKHLTSSAITVDNSISIRSNPFLRYHRSTSERLGLALDSVCYIWSSITPDDLCKLAPWARYQFLRKISIFSRDCLEENNIKAAQLFRVTPRYINNEADLRVQAKFLRPNVDGQDCILTPANAQQCLSCFQKIDRGLKRVDKAYENFNVTLHRFDCMLAVDTASATRPFSPNGSCTDCKVWYRKWLVVHSLNLWSVPPCINWCYYVQLACPHLATSKVVDYAGHPSFQCRDLHIPSASISHDQDSIKLSPDTNPVSTEKSTVASKCSCLHPCDLEEFNDLIDTTRTAEQNRPSSYSNAIFTSNEEEDFFPSPQHCMIRRHICYNMKNEAEGHRVMPRSLTAGASALREKWHTFKLNDIPLSSYLISIASVFMRSPGSTGAVPHHQDSAIQKTFTDSAGYASQWWAKHRVQRHLRFHAKTVTAININNVTPTAAPIIIDFTTITTSNTVISSGVDWRGTKWSTCSGIFIYTFYTLFFPLLLLRRPPLL